MIIFIHMYNSYPLSTTVYKNIITPDLLPSLYLFLPLPPPPPPPHTLPPKNTPLLSLSHPLSFFLSFFLNLNSDGTHALGIRPPQKRLCRVRVPRSRRLSLCVPMGLMLTLVNRFPFSLSLPPSPYLPPYYTLSWRPLRTAPFHRSWWRR